VLSALQNSLPLNPFSIVYKRGSAFTGYNAEFRYARASYRVIAHLVAWCYMP